MQQLTELTSPALPPRFGPDFRAALAELIRWRRDVRRFRRDALPDGLVERLLRLAVQAPSVGLSEPWRFVLVDDPARRRAIRSEFERCNQAALGAQPDGLADAYASLKLAGLDDAPCHLAVFSEPAPAQGHGLGRMTMPETTAYSTVMAIHTLWLAARAEGVGLGWVSILDPAGVAALLDTPPSWQFVGYLCLGYPVEACETPELERQGWEQRRGLDKVLIRR